jgi:hypothetical protein
MFKHSHSIFFIVLLACVRVCQAQYATTKPVSAPTIFAPGVISTGEYEVCPTFSLDGAGDGVHDDRPSDSSP